MPDATQPREGAPFRQILGVRFFTGAPGEALRVGLQGGLVVVPSAPVLVAMEHDASHRDALVNADLAIADSGLMVLLWRLITGERLTRVSGLEYLKLMLAEPAIREPGAVLWIMPTPEARDRNVAWLRSQGFPTTAEDCYLAPMYPEGELSDPALIEMVRRRRPGHIVVGLGGGVQERLGLHLKRQLDYRPGIHCIGAAIGFLSGEQVRIPMWADFFFLGWLFRSMSAPRKFLPRYWKARKLVGMMWKYR
ncbi:MAG: WecB/TagA/CpsF family glycosyltransferase, partial [Chthoniobacteraceae bacterium]